MSSMQIDRRNFVSSVVTTDLVKFFPCVMRRLLYTVLPFYGELKFLIILDTLIVHTFNIF